MLMTGEFSRPQHSKRPHGGHHDPVRNDATNLACPRHHDLARRPWRRIVADLLLRGKAGQLKKPRTLERYWDLGFFAELLVGAAAAAAFLWFLSPGSIQVEGKEAAAYDVRILVGASLVVGTVGSSIIAAMAERATALVNTEKAKTAVAEAKRELEHQKSAVRLADANADTTTLDAALKRLDGIEQQID